MNSNLPIQLPLFNVERQVEINGVEMGVLDNGIPYLTERGLSRMCGIDSKTLYSLAAEYASKAQKPRVMYISERLTQSGYNEQTLYLKSLWNAQEVNAYVGPVCLAILEYYSFVAPDRKEQALTAFRTLAGLSFNDFIYNAVGYNPRQTLLPAWQQFHDRVNLVYDSVPQGYFSIFREIASLIVPMIENNVPVGSKIVPDISVGLAWSNRWREIDGDLKFGQRIRYEHNYPKYFPQADSNPQEPWAYPDTALPEFRRWFHDDYLPIKYPQYIMNLKGKISSGTASKAIEAITGKKIDLK